MSIERNRRQINTDEGTSLARVEPSLHLWSDIGEVIGRTVSVGLDLLHGLGGAPQTWKLLRTQDRVKAVELFPALIGARLDCSDADTRNRLEELGKLAMDVAAGKDNIEARKLALWWMFSTSGLIGSKGQASLAPRLRHNDEVLKSMGWTSDFILGNVVSTLNQAREKNSHPVDLLFKLLRIPQIVPARPSSDLVAQLLRKEMVACLLLSVRSGVSEEYVERASQSIETVYSVLGHEDYEAACGQAMVHFRYMADPVVPELNGLVNRMINAPAYQARRRT